MALDFDYTYDLFGNLESRSLGSLMTEAFEYDELHRLTWAGRSGFPAVDYAYDSVGNITKKTDFSADQGNAYTYNKPGSKPAGAGGPNAVRSVVTVKGNTVTMSYDENGNLVSDTAGFAAEYDHQNLPTYVRRGGSWTAFAYGPDGMRTRQTSASGLNWRVYLEGFEQTRDDRKFYVGEHTLVTRGPSERKVEYLLTDRLGSVAGVADESGAIVEVRGFDAFGLPRDESWGDHTNGQLPTGTTTPRGFTAHEHLDGVGLIHMNGRAYDPRLGRFLSVDPLIQSPLSSQSLNPYSYISNNPLAYTDPTGFAADCKGKAPGEGEVCEVRGTKRDNRSARVAGRVSETITIANHNGVIYAASGSGSDAYRAIEAAALGSPQDRKDGATVGAAPFEIRERQTATCARHGTGCEDNPAFIEELGGDNPVLEFIGNIATIFIEEKYGPIGAYKINPLTDGVVRGEDAVGDLMAAASLFIPYSKGGRLVEEAGAALAKQIGRNRVSAMTPTGRMQIDLAGKPHFEKSLGQYVPAPHVKFQQLNVSSSGRANLSPGTTRPATMDDIRTARKIIERRDNQ